MSRSNPIIAVIQNCLHETLGQFKPLLEKKNQQLISLNSDQISDLPTYSSLKGVILLGGPQSGNDTTPNICAQLNLIETLLKEQIPYLGICLGMQLLGKVAGSTIVKADHSEIGFDSSKGTYTVTLTSEGKKDRLTHSLPHSFPVFQLHTETITSSTDITLLGTSHTVKHQIIKVGPCAYGIQGHIELTKPLLQTWLKKDRLLTGKNKPSIFKTYDQHDAILRETSTELITQFLNQV